MVPLCSADDFKNYGLVRLIAEINHSIHSTSDMHDQSMDVFKQQPCRAKPKRDREPKL